MEIGSQEPSCRANPAAPTDWEEALEEESRQPNLKARCDDSFKLDKERYMEQTHRIDHEIVKVIRYFRRLLAAIAGGGLLVATGMQGGCATMAEKELSEWAGFYYGDDSDGYRIDVDGTVEWEGITGVGGDIVDYSHGTGKAAYDDGTITLRFDTLGGVPGRYHKGESHRFAAITAEGYRLLLDDKTLLPYINQVNGRGWNGSGWSSIDARYLLHRVAGIEGGRDPNTGKTIPLRTLRRLYYLTHSERNTVDPTAGRIQLRNSLPPQYASRLLAHPIEGRVTQVDQTADSEPSAARMKIDLGTHHGVFVGMKLYIAGTSSSMVVKEVDAESCIASIIPPLWSEGKPTVGMKVSSMFTWTTRR